MNWQELKSSEVGSLARDTVVVVPMASIEQHGPHLPVGTDSYIGEAIASALDREFQGRLLVLPVQRLGCSEHHMAFAGTLTLQHETFRSGDPRGARIDGSAGVPTLPDFEQPRRKSGHRRSHRRESRSTVAGRRRWCSPLGGGSRLIG